MRRIRNKKAQFKIQQMSFMLLAVTLFFIIAGLFYLSIRMADLQKKAVESEKNMVLEMLTKLSSNSELGCGGNLPSSYDYDCIDADKAMILRDKSQYEEFFGVSSLVIRKIYPKDARDIDCTLGNYPDCNIIKIFGNKSYAPISTYVSLCRKNKDIEDPDLVYDKCEVGVLMADINSVEGKFEK